MKYGKPAQRPREIPEPPPAPPSESWWTNLDREAFYAEVRRRYNAIAGGKFGRMDVHTWIGNAPPPITHRQNTRHRGL